MWGHGALWVRSRNQWAGAPGRGQADWARLRRAGPDGGTVVGTGWGWTDPSGPAPSPVPGLSLSGPPAGQQPGRVLALHLCPFPWGLALLTSLCVLPGGIMVHGGGLAEASAGAGAPPLGFLRGLRPPLPRDQDPQPLRSPPCEVGASGPPPGPSACQARRRAAPGPGTLVRAWRGLVLAPAWESRWP